MLRRALVLLLVGCAALAAQDEAAPFTSLGFATAPSGLAWRAIDVPGADSAAIVAAVHVGAWHDPPGQTGLAHVVSVALSLAQPERPEAERWSVVGAGAATYIGTTCPRAEVEARLRELLAMLAGPLRLDDDGFARARAIAVLRADDYQELIPGPRLIEMARRSTAAGTPAGKQFFGVPSEMEKLTRAAVAAWVEARFRPAHTSLVVLGAVADTGVVEILRGHADARPATPAATPAVHDTAPAVVAEAVHTRIRGPFVSVVVKAPPADGPEYLPFLVAMGVVQVRCHAAFGYRGREIEAGLPLFWFNSRRGDGFAMLNRRGADGADAEAVRAELRALIRRLRSQPPPLAEVAQATFDVASAFMLPPYEGQLEAMARYPQLLQPHAELLATAHVLGWPASRQLDVGKVLVDDVFRSLQKHLADDNLTWLALTPPRDRR